ncbi:MULTISPECIES: hypothetical protein [Spirulina sp. CCY15215]|uniref:5'-methylthioadenosine/S-adenosylhomocysteine nucleosidase family protein n=1 Tax=Spirulina sp. CCY15215 TaxID=2767591 RepID=UPI00194E8A8F|nr:hypothetical protein [Spirulina major]
MAIYNLTEKQKQLLTWIVQEIHNDNLPEEFSFYTHFNGSGILEYSILEYKGESRPPVFSEGTLDALVNENLIVRDLKSSKNYRYTVLGKAYEAVKSNFCINENNMTSKADVLIVTVTDVESRAVMRVFEKTGDRKAAPVSIGDRVYFNLGTVNGARVFLTRSEMGSGGLGASRDSVGKGIEDLSPLAVIMVGIAFGVDEEKQAIGDILVTEQLHLYGLQRVGTQEGKPKIILRGDKPHASPWLINLFKSAELKWDGAKVRFGTVLTGEKLVDNLDFRDQLRDLESEAIGGEMEGAGLYVACQDKKVDWILIKSICDWADGNKGEDKKARQQIAAGNAAAFALAGLQLTPIDWQKLRGKTIKIPEDRESLGGMTDSEVASPALRMAKRSLAILEEQVASYGKAQIPVHLRLDLEDKRKEVAQLEERVRNREQNG